jgi:hypothetical protein
MKEMADGETTVEEMYEGMAKLNFEMPCTVARAIKVLTVASENDKP